MGRKIHTHTHTKTTMDFTILVFFSAVAGRRARHPLLLLQVEAVGGNDDGRCMEEYVCVLSVCPMAGVLFCFARKVATNPTFLLPHPLLRCGAVHAYIHKCWLFSCLLSRAVADGNRTQKRTHRSVS